MKAEIVSSIVCGTVALAILCHVHFKNEELTETKIAQFNSVGGTEEVITHDWECKFCIEDGYNGKGKTMYHYIDKYKRNDDHSISFIGDDGLLWNIPYPYFYIHVNEHYKKTENKN